MHRTGQHKETTLTMGQSTRGVAHPNFHSGLQHMRTHFDASATQPMGQSVHHNDTRNQFTSYSTMKNDLNSWQTRANGGRGTRGHPAPWSRTPIHPEPSITLTPGVTKTPLGTTASSTAETDVHSWTQRTGGSALGESTMIGSLRGSASPNGTMRLYGGGTCRAATTGFRSTALSPAQMPLHETFTAENDVPSWTSRLTDPTPKIRFQPGQLSAQTKKRSPYLVK